MEISLLVWTAVFGFTLILGALWAASSDQAQSRKWAKVRVRVDENRDRQAPEPPDEEFDTEAALPLLVFGTIFLFVLMLVGGK